ncbi:hypothetical protein KAU19_01955 [Candidatus Parcubacteria bacterium]|nr:hypothetical protein [Candidatus Parcubacteria bacterium]
MPKALSQFEAGKKVEMICYQKGCKGVLISVILGEEYEVNPSFIRSGGVGRLSWCPDSEAKGFNLGKSSLGGSGCRNCPKCNMLFGGIVIISNGRGKEPTIFGYDPESA